MTIMPKTKKNQEITRLVCKLETWRKIPKYHPKEMVEGEMRKKKGRL